MIIKSGSYTVYVLINNVNRRMYVGVTRRSLKERFRNGEGYRHQKILYADIKEYGWDKFDYQVFASHLTENEAFNMEKFLISELRVIDPYILYNRDAGGRYGKHCEETKEIIRDINIGRVISEETKQKIRIARAKQVISHESIMKTAEKNRGRKMSEEFCRKLGERSSKQVRCVETNEVFSSATQASKILNVSVSGISQQCNHLIPHIKGLHFEYV